MQCSTILLLTSLSLAHSFVLEGSLNSYSKHPPWSVSQNSSLTFSFSTIQPSGLLLYTDDIGQDDFFELKLTQGQLRLRFNLGSGTEVLTLGRSLNDGLWHKIELARDGSRTSLTLDGFVSQYRVSKTRDTVFGQGKNSGIFIGGLPSYYNDKLGLISLPSVVFEPRFRGAVRNVVYDGLDGVRMGQEAVEWRGLVSGPGEACERHDPCSNGGFCISTDQGPVCDCSGIDFEGAHCEEETPPATATFTGSQSIHYLFSVPIVSNSDEIGLWFKAKHGKGGVLFYTGDGPDHLQLSLSSGIIHLSVNLGSGPLETRIHPEHVRFDDDHWHGIKVQRKVQEITASVDAHHDHWTLAGPFNILSSSLVAIGGGIVGLPNFTGCLRKVTYRADTLRLGLLDLARSGHKLVILKGDVQWHCGTSIDNGVMLAEGEYLTLPLQTPNAASIKLHLRSNEPSGLVLLISNTTNYIALELFQTKLHLTIKTPKTLTRHQSPVKVTDSQWHSVEIMLNARSGLFTVDADKTIISVAASLPMVGFAHVGRYDGVLQGVWTSQLGLGFVGCLRSLEIGELVDLRLAGIDRGLRPGCHHSQNKHCNCNTGTCTEGWNRAICDCTGTDFTGSLCSKASPTILTNGHQHLLLDSPAYEVEEISFRFRTLRPTGFMLGLIGQDEVLFTMEFSRVKVLVRVGEVEKVLTTQHSLNDNTPHTLLYSRYSNVLTLTLDNTTTKTSLQPRLIRKTDQNTQKLVIASNPPYLPFTGSLSSIIVNNQQILSMIKSGSLTYNGNGVISNEELQETTYFNHTYIGLPQLKAYQTMLVSVNFKTINNGLIFYNGGKTDYVILLVQNGYLVYIVELGDGPVRLGSDKQVTDGEWHYVAVSRSGGVHRMILDGSSKQVNELGDQIHLDLNGVMYVGGLPLQLLQTLSTKTTYFTGCLASLEVGTGSYVNFMQALIPGRVVLGCEDKCANVTCFNNGVCENGGCECGGTSFTGGMCEEDSISYSFLNGSITTSLHPNPKPHSKNKLAFGLVSKSTNSQLLQLQTNTNDHLSIEIHNGQVRVTYDLGSGNISLVSERYVADGRYHVVVFERSGANGSLGVDGAGDLGVVGPGGPQAQLLNGLTSIRLGPFSGQLSGVVVDTIRLLDNAKNNPRVQVQGDVHLTKPQNDEMQKTSPSNTPSVQDSLIYSGSCTTDNDDEDSCVPITASGDDLVTAVYIPPPTKKPSTTTKYSVICDDEEDCFESSGEVPKKSSTTTEKEIITTTQEITTILDVTTPTTTTSSTSTTTTTIFIPPPTPTLNKPYPTGPVFDFPSLNASTLKPSLTPTRVLESSSDSTLVIIIIIALLLIIIVSILIIFFMCKRRDDPVYKVEEKAFVPVQGRSSSKVKEWYV